MGFRSEDLQLFISDLPQYSSIWSACSLWYTHSMHLVDSEFFQECSCEGPTVQKIASVEFQIDDTFVHIWEGRKLSTHLCGSAFDSIASAQSTDTWCYEKIHLFFYWVFIIKTLIVNFIEMTLAATSHFNIYFIYSFIYFIYASIYFSYSLSTIYFEYLLHTSRQTSQQKCILTGRHSSFYP